MQPILDVREFVWEYTSCTMPNHFGTPVEVVRGAEEDEKSHSPFQKSLFRKPLIFLINDISC